MTFRILLIDNDLNTLFALEKTLQGPNREIIRTSSVAEALDILSEKEIGLVIADSVMPDMDGFEMLEVLGVDPKMQNTYAIIIIRRDEHLTENITRGLNNGAVDYLIKPLRVEIAQAKVSVFERLFRRGKALEAERKKVQKLLHNILPETTAQELTQRGKSIIRKFDMVSVMFTDFKEFTSKAKHIDPIKLVERLDRYFIKFDDIVKNRHLEKIKTIGDAYMCAGGIPIRNRSNAIDTVLAALDMRAFILEEQARLCENGEDFWEIRIGIHTGPVVAGVVGKSKWAYDIWGDTVNTAQRLEAACIPGYVNVSEFTHKLIEPYFLFEHRGKVHAKHIGKIEMYFVLGIHPDYAEDEAGNVPNQRLIDLITKL